MTGNYEFYELGGQVYAIRIGPGPWPIWQIDLQNPGNSVFVQNTSGYPNPTGSATSVNGVIYLGANPWLVRYDPVTNTFEEECNLPSMGINAALAGLTFLPAGVPAPPCICSTEAGDMQAGAYGLGIADDANVGVFNLLDVNGLIRASGSLVTSDRHFKQDIEIIPNSIELIRRLRGTTYTFNPSALRKLCVARK
jgi:hypothetical protein